MSRRPSDSPREPSRLDLADRRPNREPPAQEQERGTRFDRDPGGMVGSSRRRMAFVIILTCAVVLFALLIAVWMYWLNGQMPGASIPVS